MAGDVDTSHAAAVSADATLTGLSGRALKVPAEWPAIKPDTKYQLGLKHAFELAGIHREGTLPSEDELVVLRNHRAVFYDLLEASQAFETAIQRGYLDVQPRQDRRGD